ncbi:uncharacterized protein LOC127750852 [Frankliniella occidentalis]|uniref:Uncharacterized protein LOC127750852 n=1 Tax=Frankliniella occidentalis TaxID=133901 RepID=A0A9C6X5F7_FRAOC|nr:uncharacterized protein LOC127750852 [Frankliniella occidentalis]
MKLEPAQVFLLPLPTRLLMAPDKAPAHIRAAVTAEQMRRAVYERRHAARPHLPHSLEEVQRVLTSPQHEHLARTKTPGQAGQPPRPGEELLFRGLIGTVGFQSLLWVFSNVVAWLNTTFFFFSDGTFDIVPLAPPGLSQLFVVVTMYMDNVIPVAYALMENRLEATYVHVLAKLNELGLRVTNATTDFQLGQANAWRRVFGATVSGCLVHHTRSSWGSVGRLGLLPTVRANNLAEKCVRLLTTVPRLPFDRIGEGFNCVKAWARETGVYAEMFAFFAYFYTQWLVRVGPRLLSCWQRYHTSTNVVESHHQHLNVLANAARVNIWELCEIFQTSHAEATAVISAADVGNRSGRLRERSYRDLAQRVRDMERRLSEGLPIFQFLNGLSHLMDNIRDPLLQLAEEEDARLPPDSDAMSISSSSSGGTVYSQEMDLGTDHLNVVTRT